jgi:predicted transglutaminase-like cysteine proteinase
MRKRPRPARWPARRVRRWAAALASAAPLLASAAVAQSPHAGSSPDVFGSVALRISHTALDARWSHVADAPPPSDPRWRRAVRAARALPDHARLSLANSWLNHAIAFQSDTENYGVSDYWASARESLARGRGDCEDYAIAKMQLLREAGIPASDLYLVIARDLLRRADHALLLVRLDDGFWVLDSGTDEVLPAEAVADYRPLVTFSVGREWIHGFRRTPKLVLASASQLSPSVGR